MNDKYRKLFLLLTLTIAFISYSNTLDGEFHFDDRIYINSRVVAEREGSFRVFKWPDNYFTGGRPITTLTLDLNYVIHGADVKGYHLVNVSLHLITGVLVFILARRFFRFLRSGDTYSDKYQSRTFDGENDLRVDMMALVTTGMFVLHPVQTEAVSYIIQRAEVLGSLFFLIVLLTLIKFSEEKGLRSIILWLLSSVLFIIGWGAKEIVVTTPVIFLLYTIYFSDKQAVKKAFIGISPILLAGIFLGIYEVKSFSGSQHAGFDIGEIGQPEYLYTQFRVYLTYIRLLFLPIKQNFDYDYALYRNFWDLNVAGSMFILLLVVIMSFYSLRIKGMWKWHLRTAGFGMLWFLVILLPTSSLIPLKDVIVEHRLYLAMTGIVIPAVAVGDMLFRKIHYADNISLGRTVTSLLLLLLLVLSFTTYKRNMVWQNDLALWEDTVKKSPDKPRVHYNLAGSYFIAGDFRRSLEHYRVAERLGYNDPKLFYNLSITTGMLGLQAESDSYLRKFRAARTGKTISD